jgi:transcription initiation factor TFIID subunit 1
MWDPSRCESIPLILDRSDKYLLFTDRSHESQELKTIREWNSMGFESRNPFYGELKVNTFAMRDLNVQHSEPAQNLYLIEPFVNSLESFHRPRLEIIKGMVLEVTHKQDFLQNEIKGAVVSTYLKDAQSLSAVLGSVVLIEQTTEWPVFMLNVGMGTLLVAFWHKVNPDDNVEIQNDPPMHVLEPNQRSPFMAKLPHNQAITALVCRLFRVPLIKHEVNSTDFLLIRPTNREVTANGGSRFYIRSFNAIYLAGLIESHEQVMQPNTNDTRDFHKNFIKAILINFFRGTDQVRGRRTIQISQIREEFFPDVGETKLRGILKEFSTFSRGSTPPAWCRKDKINYDGEFQATRITPEQVCEYQSMLVGLLRLRRDGVNVLTSSQRMTNRVRNLTGVFTSKIAEKIEFALMKTPWAKTANVKRAFEERPVEMVEGEDGEHVMRGANRRNKGGEGSRPRQIAKTDADLRSLNLHVLIEKLLELGLSMAEINSLDRWKKVGVLRLYASRKEAAGGENSLSL